ncbi:MAG: RNA polymerase sigma factor [Roseburia sp.]|nr:RNA polymerase sigma factor [Roseburia sp.]
MTEKERLTQLLETELLPKIYGFCVLKMNTRQEAEDLSQEICMEVLKTIQRGKHIENMDAFVWSVANHMFYNRLRKKKHDTTVYLPETLPSAESPEEEILLQEERALLRREIALMTGDYRKAVIMHYYDNLSCKEIGVALGKSEGTVKWWLYEARKVIEKGMDTMREFGEKSYRPGSIRISCQGVPGSNYEPMSCVQRKSTQNILLAAYQSPVTIDELCMELGIAAPYVEDEVENLVRNELMREVSKGKYQTDFVILPGSSPQLANKIYAALFPKYFDVLMEFLEARKGLLTSREFNTADFSWDRLLWVYIFIFTELIICRYTNKEGILVKEMDMPLRMNGGNWLARGFDDSACGGERVRMEKYQRFDGPVHKQEEIFTVGFFHAWSGVSSRDFFDTPEEVFVLCGEIIKGKTEIEELNEEQKYLFGIALERKLFVETPEGFRQNYYFVERDIPYRMAEMAEELYRETEGLMKQGYNLILEEFQKSVPAHLHWQMGNFLAAKLRWLITCSLYEASNEGILSEPDENNKTWLSLYASEK